MNDNEIKDLIKKDSDKLEIPDSLSPENIEKKLNSSKRAGITHIRRYVAVAAAAFVCLMVPLTLSNMERPGSDPNYNERQAATSDLAGIPQVSLSEAFKGAFYTAESEEDLKKQIDNSNKRRQEANVFNGEDEVFAVEDAVAAPAAKQAAGSQNSAAESSRTTGAAAEELHSETNTREKGVDEGDIIKTDGKYIYVVK
ncbi:MAG: beta-propeller domain-containing protein, partial [Lachnospiraceae bacterium]|nr:beta-propeller domain-containing protein [Lachnospiraceae bacterium]